MDVPGLLISFFRAILGLAIIFFIPGFAITWVLYITSEDLPPITRIALSFILSLTTVMLSALFLDYVIGVDTTPVNIVVTLVIIILLMIVIWGVRYIRLMRPVRWVFAKD